MQLFDIIIVIVVFISALLGLKSGFTRRVLSLLGWVVAGVAAWWAIQLPPLVDFARQYVQNDKLAVAVVGLVALMVVLLIMSVISVRISDWVLDSAIGPFDRTLGGLLGLAMGMALVTLAWMIYAEFTPQEKQPGWIRNARLLPLVRDTAGFVSALVPEEKAEKLRQTLRMGKEKVAEAVGKAAKEAAGSIGRGDAQRLKNMLQQ